MDYYAYALITDNPIVVDFSGCKYLDDLNENRTIQIRGFQSMPDELQEYCKPMWDIFSDLQKECRNIVVCRES